MSDRKWGVVIPPMGAAREVMLSAARALHELGVAISVVDFKAYDEMLQSLLRPEAADYSVDLFNQAVLSRCVEEGWDILFSGALSPINSWLLVQLERLSVKRVHWFYEDYRLLSYWHDQSHQFDLFCAVQRGRLQEQIAPSSYRYLPTAASLLPAPPLVPWRARRWHCGFVGLPTPWRVALMVEIAEAGFSLMLAGPGWVDTAPALAEYVVADRWVSAEESVRFMQGCRVGVNLSQNQPKEMSEAQISPRVYDLAVAGVVVLTERADLLGELTAIDPLTFATPAEAVEKLAQLATLTEPPYDLTAARESVWERHSYSARMRELVVDVDVL